MEVLFEAVLDCDAPLVRNLCSHEHLDALLSYTDRDNSWTPLLLAAAQAGDRVSHCQVC